MFDTFTQKSTRNYTAAYTNYCDMSFCSSGLVATMDFCGLGLINKYDKIFSLRFAY